MLRTRQHDIEAEASSAAFAAARVKAGSRPLLVLLRLESASPGVSAVAARAVCYARNDGAAELVCSGAQTADLSLLARIVSAAYAAGAWRVSLDLDAHDERLSVLRQRCPAARGALHATGAPRPPLVRPSWARNRAQREPSLVASPVVEAGR